MAFLILKSEVKSCQANPSDRVPTPVAQTYVMVSIVMTTASRHGNSTTSMNAPRMSTEPTAERGKESETNMCVSIPYARCAKRKDGSHPWQKSTTSFPSARVALMPEAILCHYANPAIRKFTTISVIDDHPVGGVKSPGPLYWATARGFVQKFA